MLSPSLEDYLEEVYRFFINKESIRIKDIANTLRVSMPSVVKGLKRLHNLGYITYIPYEDIIVTDKGKRVGKFLVQRNKILKDFVTIIGSDCDVKQEAEAMEHYLSKSTIIAIEKLVKYFSNNEEILKNYKNYKIQSNLDEFK
ncbi:MAG: DNA-binding protein [Firmicutes bacterium]|nr:DNA-binding protein [Bacillota bacterium]